MDRFFEFEKAKLFDTWKLLRNNKYSNKKIEYFHNFFRDFYNKIKSEDIKLLTIDQKTWLKFAIRYFQTRVNCLSNNTATNAPYEVVESIKLAAKEWVDDIDKYIILTKYGDYSFLYDPDEDAILAYIENDYSIPFSYKTILLSIPQHYYRDFLNNVVLYHEAGHFVDRVKGVSNIAVSRLLCDFRNNINLNDIYDYFPFLRGISSVDIFNADGSIKNIEILQIIHSHFKEYFADIFASRYVGENIEKYLKYLTYPKSETENYSPTHPSNKLRFKMIDDFIQERSNYVIDILQSILEKKGLPKLCKISSTIKADDLYRLLPVELTTDQDVHALYSLAWEVWDGDRNRFKKENNMSFDLQPTQLYTIINNLVEKSISNYLIKTKWQNVSK